MQVAGDVAIGFERLLRGCGSSCLFAEEAGKGFTGECWLKGNQRRRRCATIALHPIRSVSDNTPANALNASATIFEALSDIDSKFAKIADKEYDAISNEVKKWFKKLAVCIFQGIPAQSLTNLASERGKDS